MKNIYKKKRDVPVRGSNEPPIRTKQGSATEKAFDSKKAEKGCLKGGPREITQQGGGCAEKKKGDKDPGNGGRRGE